MFDKLEILKMAGSMANHAAARQSVLARNVANADTPGYRTKDIASFAKTYRDSADSFAPRATRAGHFSGSVASTDDYAPHVDASASVSPNGNSVSLESEMMKSVQTRIQYDTALAVYKSVLGIMRSSLGR